jgi:hypothetical protein
LSVPSLTNFPVTVRVLDSIDQHPIAGAVVNSYYDDELPIPFGSGITDGQGYCKLYVTGTWYYMNIKAQVKNYDLAAVRILHTIAELVTIPLTPSAVPTYNVRIYALDSVNHRLQNVKVTVAGKVQLTNADGLSEFILSAGQYQVSFEGPGLYVSGITWVVVNFSPYTGSISFTGDAVFTAYVQSSIISSGVPPPPPADFWNWLIGNWPWIIVGGVIVVGGYLLYEEVKRRELMELLTVGLAARK